MRVLHARAVMCNQRPQIVMVIPAMLGDQPRSPQPTALLATPTGDLEHPHALRAYVAKGDHGFS